MKDDGGSRYRIERRLGQGGMGEVWLARDSNLDRPVALKRLTSVGGDDDGARRLLREARSLAALDHPFICKTYETGELDGRPHIAMEYVAGVTLKERMGATGLPLREALRLAIEIAEALDYAHRQGIVHRDLKPSNVMVTPEEHVKLLDFGIARHVPAATATGPGETRTLSVLDGSLCGTLEYMSPEQLQGQPADAQSDIFAFGLLFHEMLTGRHPYQRPSAAATASAILTEPVPSLAGRLSQHADVLEHILRRMLARERSDRYASARDVRADLAALVVGGRPAPAPRPRRTWRLALAAGVSMIVATAVFWLTDVLRVSEPALAFKERDWVIIADFENLTGDQAFDRALQAALTVAIEQSQHVNVIPQARIREGLRRMQRPDADRVDAELASDLATREGARVVIAGSVAQVGERYALTARVIDPHTRLPVLSEAATADSKSDVLNALDELSRTLRRRLGESLASIDRQNRPLPLATTSSLEALNMYVDASLLAGKDVAGQLRLLQQAVKLDPDFALAHADLGLLLYHRNQRSEGEVHFTRALSLLDRLTTREQLWIQALADDTRGNREQAVGHYETYLAQYPDDTVALFRLGWSRMAGLGQREAAADAFRRLIAIDPADAGAYVNLATCYSGLRRERDALDAYERAFELRPEMQTSLFVNHEYGFTLVRSGDVQKASENFRKMIAQDDKALQARGRRSMALLEMYRGRYGDAIRELRESIIVNAATSSGPSELRDRLLLASALQARGATTDARAELAAAARLAEKMTLAPGWLHLLGRAHARLGMAREAERVLARLPPEGEDLTAASFINRSTTGDAASRRLLRGEVALARGRASEALEGFEIAHRLHQNSDSFDARVAAYLALRRDDDAIKALEELIDHRPLGGEFQESWLQAHLQLGALYERQGKRADATRVYEALQAIWRDADPDLPAARELRARLKTP